MTFRSCVLLGSIVMSLQMTRAQERAPNGEIYNELRPFVGLEGIRYQITGLEGGTVFNVPGLENVADPEKAVTGLSRAEREQRPHAGLLPGLGGHPADLRRRRDDRGETR